ncbi:MAG TPA: ATP-binding cassette domain-containing protein [Ignavibacteriales bacterium]|nr:ATP-binding cassette domain-containing protein [Ignavibacteriales bacterium]
MFELNNISKSFGEKKVLKSISASFSFGITGIAGSNGCGKTTMFKILTGLLKPEGGKILYNSEEINTQSSFWRSKIGYLPQTIGLYSRMTVYDLLDYMLVLSDIKDKKLRKERIDYLTGELNLKAYLKTPCGYLSGGVKQRAGIAQAFIHDPEIVFLDEPTNNLDAEERERFHNFLDKFRLNKIILYVGHIIEEMGYISDRMLIFKNGEIVFHGKPSDLLNESRYSVRQILLSKNEALTFEPHMILRKIAINGKTKIIYRPGQEEDNIGEAAEAHFEDVYKIITRD